MQRYIVYAIEKRKLMCVYETTATEKIMKIYSRNWRQFPFVPNAANAKTAVHWNFLASLSHSVIRSTAVYNSIESGDKVIDIYRLSNGIILSKNE